MDLDTGGSLGLRRLLALGEKRSCGKSPFFLHWMHLPGHTILVLNLEGWYSRFTPIADQVFEVVVRGL